MIITAAAVTKHTTSVTSEQVGRCSKVYGSDNKPFYLVLSETDDLTEYKVTYTHTHGFSCTCPSGAYGFANVKHASGVCKHVRYAVAAAQEEKAALKEQMALQAQALLKEVEEEKAVLIIAGQPATAGEYERVMNARPARENAHKAQSPKAFCILK